MKKGSSSGVLSFLRGTSRDSSPKMERKATPLVDSVKYIPKSEQGEGVEIDNDALTASLASLESDRSRNGKTSQHIELRMYWQL